MNRFLDFMQNRGLLDNEKANFSIPHIRPPTDSLRITPTGHYRLRPIREQKHTYLDTVISQKDYDRLKRRLKRMKITSGISSCVFSPPPARASVNCARSKWRICSLAISISTPKAARYGDCSSPVSLCGEAIPYFASRGIDSGFLFLTRRRTCISARAIEMQLKIIAKRYRINPATMYPHSFRHRYAINFLKRFNDISLLADLLGHDSIETTRIYLMKSSQEQQTVIDRVVTW